jgi:hypothetical protein
MLLQLYDLIDIQLLSANQQFFIDKTKGFQYRENYIEICFENKKGQDRNPALFLKSNIL